MLNNQNQDGYIVKYVILTQDIIGDKNLSLAERLVLARMSGFSQFFESSEATGEFLGISAITVTRAKQKLAKLGYIEEAQNTGRGKVWSIRLTQNVNQTDKICQSDRHNMSTYNKVENKEENISTKVDIGESPSEEHEKSEKPTYGDAHINSLMELWEAETGIIANRAKQNRYACYNLIRTRGYDGAEAVVRMIGRSIRSGDQYAPRIGSFRDLVGKYEKLSSLEAWNARQVTPKSTLPPAMRADKPDYFYQKEQSEEERAEVSAMFKEGRKKLPFMRGSDV